jgi:uncharacterized protein (TIGR02453 family)
MPEFIGIPIAALDFYEDLEADNSRAFWLAHKEIYTESVLGPVTALAAELAPEFGSAKIFRPYRDVRFAKDKTPYKTQQGVWFHDSNRYLQIDAAGLMLGGGNYHFSPDQLARYRRAVDSPVPAGLLVKALADCHKAGLTLGGEQLRRIPTGFAKDHPHPELIRYKNIVVAMTLGSPDWLTTAQAKTEIVRRFRKMAPVVQWLDHHVGKAEPGPRSSSASTRTS